MSYRETVTREFESMLKREKRDQIRQLKRELEKDEPEFVKEAIRAEIRRLS